MILFKSNKSLNQPCQALAVDWAGRPDPESVDRRAQTCARYRKQGTVDRAVDQPESICSLASGPLGRLPTPYGQPVGLPPPPESGILAVGRPLSRPAQVAGQRARFVHVGRPVRSTARAWQAVFQDLKLGF